MSKPVWALQSNTAFGPFQERESIRIDFTVTNADEFVPDNQEPFRETDQFINDEALKKYADDFYFYLRTYNLPNGSDGSTTAWGGNPPNYTQYTPRASLGVYKFPRAKFVETDVLIKDKAIGFVGLAKDGVLIKSVNSQKINYLNGTGYTENAAIFPVQNFFTDGSGIIESDRKFFYHTDPKLIYTKTPNQHSPIIGYAFDGNPIYGPYGYSEANDPSSPVKIMETSYRLTEVQRADGTIPDGTYIEDFVYVTGLGDLDQYNARDCVTPEYPNGVHAYFVTVDSEDPTLPRYPYIIGPEFFSKPLIPNGSFTFPGDITLSVISGQLPPGTRIDGHSIVGRPFEVAKTTDFRFVLRATNIEGVSDRTFNIAIEGPDAPVWLTPPGLLPAGHNDALYVIDNEYVEFKLSAIDLDLPAGDNLSFYVPPKGGKLPPGLVLSKEGTIKGYPTPLLAILPNDFNGNYDKNLFEQFPYDFGVRPSNGFDTFLYDNLGYDYFDSVKSPKKLNRYYQFTVRVTDGVYFTDRVFKIYVVGDDFFRADTTIMQVGTNTFTADNTYLRKPIWITPQYLGRKRANNYITVFLDTYDANNVQGPIGYILDPINPDILAKAVNSAGAGSSTILVKDYNSVPSIGMKLALEYDAQITYTITSVERVVVGGVISFKIVLNKALELKFVPGEKINIGKSIIGEVSVLAPAGSNYIILKNVIDTMLAIPTDVEIDVGMRFSVKPVGIIFPIYTVNNVQRVVVGLNVYYNLTLNKPLESNVSTKTIIIIGPESKLPPGMLLDDISGEIYGDVPYQPAVTIPYRFSIRAIRYDIQGLYERVSSLRTFTLDILGEVDSVIKFITPGNLGSISANFISGLQIVAKTTVANAVLNYSLVGGKLPPGLELVTDGTIQGKVNQFSSNLTNENGLITFDDNTTTFDNFKTTFDREYTFTVYAEDQFRYSATTKTFNLSVVTPNDKLYSNIYVKPFVRLEKRKQLLDFFTDPTIFERDKIYRPSDPSFGVQQELKMLLYAGIETKNIDQYVMAFNRSYKKRFRLGNIKKAIAKEPGTNNSIYEVIYIDIIDNQESVTGQSSDTIITRYITKNVKANQSRNDIIDSDYNDNNLTKIGLNLLPRISPRDRVISADYSAQLVSDINKTDIFGNSVATLRKEIAKVGDTERNFLPLWMRTPQSFSGIEQGFTRGIVLCYCNVGQADHIMLNIKYSKFDFKKIDFTVDRVIIDSVTGESGDKYIAFAAREVING